MSGAEQKSEIGLASLIEPGQVLLLDMAKLYKIELVEQEVGQLLDGLEIRKESWSARPIICGQELCLKTRYS